MRVSLCALREVHELCVPVLSVLGSAAAVSSNRVDVVENVRILVVGGHGTGRTSLCRRFIEKTFSPDTPSLARHTRTVTVNGKEVLITVRESSHPLLATTLHLWYESPPQLTRTLCVPVSCS